MKKEHFDISDNISIDNDPETTDSNKTWIVNISRKLEVSSIEQYIKLRDNVVYWINNSLHIYNKESKYIILDSADLTDEPEDSS